MKDTRRTSKSASRDSKQSSLNWENLKMKIVLSHFFADKINLHCNTYRIIKSNNVVMHSTAAKKLTRMFKAYSLLVTGKVSTERSTSYIL